MADLQPRQDSQRREADSAPRAERRTTASDTARIVGTSSATVSYALNGNPGACVRAAELNPDRVNPSGAAIALGHPVGATGAILALRAAYGMHRNDAKSHSSACASVAGRLAMVFDRF